jgi:hypothetical protein
MQLSLIAGTRGKTRLQTSARVGRAILPRALEDYRLIWPALIFIKTVLLHVFDNEVKSYPLGRSILWDYHIQAKAVFTKPLN